MFNFKKLIGFEVVRRNSEVDKENAQIIADIDMDFSISENGSLSRSPKENLKNKHLMDSFARASRFITK